MATVITVCGLKGGIGKSLTSTILACAYHRSGRRALLVHADSQGTVRTWASKATSAAAVPPVVAMDARNLARDLLRVAEAYDIVIVDTPARLGKEARAAMMLADLVLLPAGRGGPGLWALAETLEILDEAEQARGGHLPARILTNMADHTAMSVATRQQLAELSVPLLPCALGLRVAFDEAMALGTDVGAHAPASLAAREAAAFHSAVEAALTHTTEEEHVHEGNTAQRDAATAA